MKFTTDIKNVYIIINLFFKMRALYLFITLVILSISTSFGITRSELKKLIHKKYPNSKRIEYHHHKTDSTSNWIVMFNYQTKHYILQLDETGIVEVEFIEISQNDIPNTIDMTEKIFEYGYLINYPLENEIEYLIVSLNKNNNIGGSYYYHPDGSLVEYYEFKK